MEKPPEVPATLNQTGPASHSSVLHTPASIMGPPPPIIERTTAQGILGPAPYPSLALSNNISPDLGLPSTLHNLTELSSSIHGPTGTISQQNVLNIQHPPPMENPAPSRSRRRAREDDDDASSDAASVASSTQRVAAPRLRATDVAIGLVVGTTGLLILTMEILVSLLGGPLQCVMQKQREDLTERSRQTFTAILTAAVAAVCWHRLWVPTRNRFVDHHFKAATVTHSRLRRRLQRRRGSHDSITELPRFGWEP